ncbi:glycyl-radical enzyme activating protein [Planctomycetota bacterium]
MSIRGEIQDPEPRALVLEIQRMSTEDGPGIRTTVFLKGCSLKCTWCHNPESLSREPQVVWHDWKCIACRACVDACSAGARTLGAGGAEVSSERCSECGLCIDACPTTAIEVAGRRLSLEEVAGEVAKDLVYFETSGGGVTLSGGEPALQPTFAEALLAKCRTLGIHTALDTCGMCGKEALLRVIEHADMVLFDLKEIDGEKHRRFTGQSNETILKNLLAVGEHARRGDPPCELWIRTPLVPRTTATEENLTGIGSFLARHLGDVVARWELCAFNNLCKSKYKRLGLDWEFNHSGLLSKAELSHFTEAARRSGVDPEVVHADGPTAS